MDPYIKLTIAAFLPVSVSVIFYFLNTKTPFSKLSYEARQIIFGLVFGALAIVGTEWGIPINGAQANCRDAAVLTAGLIFGAPAGIIAGVIGAVERWFAVAWGVGTFTRVACTVSTFIAGIYSALLRKFMFENRKPGWLISFAVGLVMEVFHLTMVFITNMGTPIEAMAVVKSCTAPLLIANSISVMLSSMIISLIEKDSVFSLKRDKIHISQTIQGWLLITVAVAFLATSVFVFRLQTELAKTQTDSTLSLALENLSEDIDEGTYTEDPSILKFVKNRRVGKGGFMLVFDESGKIVSAPDAIENSDFADLSTSLNTEPENETFNYKNSTGAYYCRYIRSGNYNIVSVLGESEAMQLRNIAIFVNSFMEILAFAVMFALIYFLIKSVVVKKLMMVNGSLSKITDGDLNEVVNVRSNAEFSSLSDDINSTVSVLKNYIAEASARIDKELELAKDIQLSSLPNVDLAFPNRRDFDIYAIMNPAKEVGGDFYDFYLTENDKLNFLIADVSGKGIPAAMFMMRAKTELKSLTEAGLSVNDAFTEGNNALTEGNDAGMFVTAWQAGVDLSDGTVIFANAGHNPPLVRRGNGKFEYLKSPAGFVLAGMDGIKYKSRDLKLESGDILFLYTDGVTEATNASNELFGEERLLEAVNSVQFETMHELCDKVKESVDSFVDQAPQFDDITMVAFRFIGTPSAPEISFENASLEDIPAVTDFVDEVLENIGCSQKNLIRINIAIDEIFSNIIKYGYKSGTGPVSVRVLERTIPHTVYIRFCDEGIPYNPLIKEDPDVSLSADERSIGGLGIFMVKKTMDDMKYKYENGQNILTITKNLD